MPRAGVEPARPFSGKRRILSPQCLPISPSGRRLSNAHLRRSVTRAAHARNALSLLVTGRVATHAQQPPIKKGSRSFPCKYGAGKESRTLDLNLGKVALYQLSYSRIYCLPLTSLSMRCSKPRIISLFFGCIGLHTKKFKPQNRARTSPRQCSSQTSCTSTLKTESGGAVRSRTGLTGFAIRGITALLPRQKFTFL